MPKALMDFMGWVQYFGIQEEHMGIYYSTVDGVVLTFSKIHKNGVFDEIDFRFERPNDKGGFDFAEGKLPNNMFCKTYGFSED